MLRARNCIFLFAFWAGMAVFGPAMLSAQQNVAPPIRQLNGAINGFFVQDDGESDGSDPFNPLPNSKNVDKSFSLAKEAVERAEYSTAIELLQQHILDSHARPRMPRSV